MVGEHAVGLLGHAAIERAHPRLDVDDGHSRADSAQRPGEGRVGVAVHEHARRRDGGHDRLELGQHARELGHIGPAADCELTVGLRKPQFPEEHLRQLRVEVLARVDERLPVHRAQRA